MKLLIHDSEGTLLLEKTLKHKTEIRIDPENWTMQITDNTSVMNTVVDLESEDTFAISFIK